MNKARPARQMKSPVVEPIQRAVEPIMKWVFEGLEDRVLLSGGPTHPISHMGPTSAVTVANNSQPSSSNSSSSVASALSQINSTNVVGLPSGRIIYTGGGSAGATPTQVRHFYKLDTLDTYDPAFPLYNNNGSNQEVVVVGTPIPTPRRRSPTRPSDLTVFSTKFGLPGADVGVDNTLGGNMNDVQGAVETQMEIDWVHAMAPAAAILLVTVPSTRGVVAVDDMVKGFKLAVADLNAGLSYGPINPNDIGGVVTTGLASNGFIPGDDFKFDSVFLAHAQEPSQDNDFKTIYKTANISFVVPTGDIGGQQYLGYPASSPWVTAVGGSLYAMDATGNRQYETAWTSSTGGTTSQPLPSYQAGIRVGKNALKNRAAPDLTMLGSSAAGGVPVYLNYDQSDAYTTSEGDGRDGWYEETGTSIGAPMFAGMVADANELRADVGLLPLGIQTQYDQISGVSVANPHNQLNDLLYQAYANNRALNYYDIATGNNTTYRAGKNFDLATGMGSPIASGLIPTLAGTVGSIASNFKFNGSINSPFNNPPVTLTYLRSANAVAKIGLNYISFYDSASTGTVQFASTPSLDPKTGVITQVVATLSTANTVITRAPYPDNHFTGTGQVNVVVNQTDAAGVTTVISTTSYPVAITGIVTGRSSQPKLSGQIYTVDANGNRLLRVGSNVTFEGTFTS